MPRKIRPTILTGKAATRFLAAIRANKDKKISQERFEEWQRNVQLFNAMLKKD
ncbi:hypothetical protein [Chitinophaga eiseniae]|uniref:Uncharacterized protein n=1 Tax=Chitinophaga eiseniae TaxID=634771 RepID=A0A847SJ24_9BACT|nr:hypothetical protein [Chitinophaga eiseniae]NLR79075.1 hypothetical protein [Chitinophaga eiseniae]